MAGEHPSSLRGRPGLTLGVWVLESFIGRGTFGEVWRAHHSGLVDRLGAVKLATDPLRARLVREEAVTLDRLVHPNIVPVLDLDRLADPPYLVTEFVPGRSLRQLLSPEGWPIDQVLAVARQVLGALAYAHARGIVHHDVKPDNVLLTPDGTAKLIDFGLGRVESLAVSSQLQSGTLAMIGELEGRGGTPAYMPPEQWQGKAVDHRCDVYAFGMLWFELLVGRLPAGRDELPTTVRPALPPLCDQVYERATAALERRALSADDLLRLLNQFATCRADTQYPVPAKPTEIASGPNIATGAETTTASAAPELARIDSTGRARTEQTRWAHHLRLATRWCSPLGIDFVLIPPGYFRMGAPADDVFATREERLDGTVTIQRAFYAARFPLTNQNAREFLDAPTARDDARYRQLLNDRTFVPAVRNGESDPAAPCVGISADDVAILCEWLGARDDRAYRLPTEAEWEYLARAGQPGPYWWGASEGRGLAVFGTNAPQPPCDERSNAWYLLDVLGNVAEWTASEYGPINADTVRTAAPFAARGSRVVRGGSWQDTTLVALRVTRRWPRAVTTRAPTIGARLVFDAPDPQLVTPQQARESSSPDPDPRRRHG